MSSTNTVNLNPSNIGEALDLLFHKNETVEDALCIISTNVNTVSETTSALSESIAQTNAGLANRVSKDLLGQPNGVATLNESGVLSAVQWPDSGSDFETGVWTPTLIGSTTAGNFTYSGRTGKYVKVGKLCIAYVNASITAITSAPAGEIRISGLPFNVSVKQNSTSQRLGEM